MKKKIFIIAGEASGDILAGDLMRSILKKNPNVTFAGVGGEEMEKLPRFRSLFDIRDIAVMGLFEVLKHLFTIKRRINQTVHAIKKFNPDMVITVDAPGFNMAVVRRVKPSMPNTTFVHYVAPQVWAWKEKRAEKIAHLFDALLCFFPFEPKYFERYGLRCFVVGHTASENVRGSAQKFCHNHNIKSSDVVVTMLAGTRRQMMERLLPIYEEVANTLHSKIPNLHIVMPTTKNMEYALRSQTRYWKYDPIIITGKQNRYDAFVASDVALSISGTAVLELAVATTPTVVAYRVAPITYAIAKHFVKIKDVTLPNIIAGKTIIPEFIQNECTAPNLSRAILRCINDKKYREKMIANLSDVRTRISGVGGKSSSDTSATAILSLLKK